MKIDHSFSSIGNNRLILLFNSLNLRSRLPFCGGILQFAIQRPREKMKRKLPENDRNESRTGHWKNTESRFLGTRTMPYTHWGCVCQSERAPALGENASYSVVFWTVSDRDVVVIVRQSARMNQFFRRRPKADQRAQWNQGRYEQTNYSAIRRNIVNWAVNPVNWQGKNDFVLLLFESEKEIVRLRSNSSILNDESRTTKVNLHTGQQRDSEILKTVDEKSTKIDKNRSGVQQEMNMSYHHTLCSSRSFFCVSKSCLNVISERFSSHPDWEFRLSWDIFLI